MLPNFLYIVSRGTICDFCYKTKENPFFRSFYEKRIVFLYKNYYFYLYIENIDGEFFIDFYGGLLFSYKKFSAVQVITGQAVVIVYYLLVFYYIVAEVVVAFVYGGMEQRAVDVFVYDGFHSVFYIKYFFSREVAVEVDTACAYVKVFSYDD